MDQLYLIGAGGHAKMVAAIWRRRGGAIAGYADPVPSNWLQAHRLAEADIPAHGIVALGLGGATPEALARRLAIFERGRDGGWHLPALIDPSAEIAADAALGDGAQVMPRAILNVGARIGHAVIVNTGAIIEHDAVLGDGAHVGPGAIVLGEARIGRAAMIGAGAVIVQGMTVPDGHLVRAGSVFTGA